MRWPRQRIRYVLLISGAFVLLVTAIATGTAAAAHHLPGLSRAMAGLAGVAFALVVAAVVTAVKTQLRIPWLARQLAEMTVSMTAGEPVTGSFVAALREARTTAPLSSRWKYGRVQITPQSVAWIRKINGRTLDLTGAHCGGERRPDTSYTEMNLQLPRHYRGENVVILAVKANGADVEIAAPAQLLEILRYSLEHTKSLAG